MDFNIPILAPSILAADFANLGNDIKKCTDAGINWIHCDIMDGHFVPNISYGPSIVKAAAKSAPDAFIDVHLMIENPDRYVDDYFQAGADLITVHYEACPHLHRSIQNIKKYGIMAGVAINPATSIQSIEPILEYVDLVLIMSVNPGFGGQSFIESAYNKLKTLAELREENNYSFLIEVDGGIGPKTITNAVKSGAEILVAGSSVFNTDDIPKRIEELNELMHK